MATIMEALGGMNGQTIMEAIGGQPGQTIAEAIEETGFGTNTSTPIIPGDITPGENDNQ